MFSELAKRNSRRSRRENGLFFTSLLIAIIAFYIILSLSHQDVMVFLQRMESDAVNRLLTLVPVLYGLTLFILFFLVYYANRFQLARRRHEFGVYLMLGMQRRKLFGMLLAEDLRSSLIALAIGLPAAVLISELISLVTARLVGLGIVGHRFALSLPAIGWTAVGFLAIKLLASLILSGKIVREEIGALLTETPEGTKKQRPAAVYAAALVLGIALLAGAYTSAIRGYAWSGLRYMAGTLALGVAGTLLLFYGLRVIIDRLARRGDRAGKLRVFNFRQVEETVIHRSGTLAISSLLILAALCCFGAGVATARSSRAEAHTLDYTFPTDSKSADTVRETLTAHGLDSAFSDLFEMRIGRVRTSTDYQNTVKFPALQRTIDAMPVSDERQQLQYMLEAVGYPHLIALSGYNRLLAAAGLPELTLADDEAAVYCDSEVSLASRTALINRLIAEDSAITIDGAPFTLVGQVQSVSVVTDRSITMLFALIVPDAAFEHYTQGDYDVYLDGVLAPSMTEGKSLMNAIADMNGQLDPLGLEYESYLQNLGRELFYIVAASYLTIYLAIIFLVVANTIIGVQFLMGQQKAARRYRTLVLDNRRDTLPEAVGFKLDYARNRMQAFIDQMLYYARLRGARRDYRFERLTLRSCIDEVLDDYRPLLEEKGFRVEIRLADETVFTDRRGLCFLLGQLVSNSVKYTSDAPVLTFSLTCSAAETVLTVRDNGPGVRACDLPYVFEKGFTGDSGHEKSKATGMGLYLAREIAKELGLTLSAASDWGAGFAVCISFPVVTQ